MKPIRYPVNDCYPCVQGEGMQTGVAMVLLRLQGCEVKCPYCDTRETWSLDTVHQVAPLTAALGATPRYACLTAEQIAGHITARHRGPAWVLVTGGEPARYDLRPLAVQLRARGFKIALETSGTATGHLHAGLDWVCVSPKIDMPGGKAINAEVLAGADEIKHVVATPRDIEALDKLLADHTVKKTVQICLQPVSLNDAATALCLQTVIRRGWRLSVQLHKYLGSR